MKKLDNRSTSIFYRSQVMSRRHAEGGLVKRKALFTVFCLTLAPCMVWANPIEGTTNPSAFNQSIINWCQQFDCNLAGFRGHFTSSWVSNDGATGKIGLSSGSLFFSNKQGPPPTGVNWVGNFPSGMGVLYNGDEINLRPAGIKITFDSAVEGVGAYIQGSAFGEYSATIFLFGQNNNPLGSFTAQGFSCSSFVVPVGTCPNNERALFIGAFDDVPIFGARFDVIDAMGNEDFSIGTVKSGPFAVPEPSTLLLFASSALGVAPVIRRRSRGVL